MMDKLKDKLTKGVFISLLFIFFLGANFLMLTLLVGAEGEGVLKFSWEILDSDASRIDHFELEEGYDDENGDRSIDTDDDIPVETGFILSGDSRRYSMEFTPTSEGVKSYRIKAVPKINSTKVEEVPPVFAKIEEQNGKLNIIDVANGLLNKVKEWLGLNSDDRIDNYGSEKLDLTISNIEEIATNNNKYGLRIKYRNTGPNNAKEGFKISITSNSAILENGDKTIYKIIQTGAEMISGEERHVDFEIIRGNYEVSIIIDSDNIIDERSEDNNTASKIIGNSFSNITPTNKLRLKGFFINRKYYNNGANKINITESNDLDIKWETSERVSSISLIDRNNNNEVLYNNNINVSRGDFKYSNLTVGNYLIGIKFTDDDGNEVNELRGSDIDYGPFEVTVVAEPVTTPTPTPPFTGAFSDDFNDGDYDGWECNTSGQAGCLIKPGIFNTGVVELSAEFSHSSTAPVYKSHAILYRDNIIYSPKENSKLRMNVECNGLKGTDNVLMSVSMGVKNTDTGGGIGASEIGKITSDIDSIGFLIKDRGFVEWDIPDYSLFANNNGEVLIHIAVNVNLTVFKGIKDSNLQYRKCQIDSIGVVQPASDDIKPEEPAVITPPELNTTEVVLLPDRAKLRLTTQPSDNGNNWLVKVRLVGDKTDVDKYEVWYSPNGESGGTGQWEKKGFFNNNFDYTATESGYYGVHIVMSNEDFFTERDFEIDPVYIEIEEVIVPVEPTPGPEPTLPDPIERPDLIILGIEKMMSNTGRPGIRVKYKNNGLSDVDKNFKIALTYNNFTHSNSVTADIASDEELYIDSLLDPGTYRNISAEIDFGKAIIETNEDNNVLSVNDIVLEEEGLKIIKFQVDSNMAGLSDITEQNGIIVVNKKNSGSKNSVFVKWEAMDGYALVPGSGIQPNYEDIKVDIYRISQNDFKNNFPGNALYKTENKGRGGAVVYFEESGMYRLRMVATKAEEVIDESSANIKPIKVMVDVPILTSFDVAMFGESPRVMWSVDDENVELIDHFEIWRRRVGSQTSDWARIKTIDDIEQRQVTDDQITDGQYQYGMHVVMTNKLHITEGNYGLSTGSISYSH